VAGSPKQAAQTHATAAAAFAADGAARREACGVATSARLAAVEGGKAPAERRRLTPKLRAEASSAVLATALLASIEGGMMHSQTRKDPASLRIAVEAGMAQVRMYLTQVCTNRSTYC
jgi:TetR/AcrR family transcriptional regulator, transcriptional repressor for nem operon